MFLLVWRDAKREPNKNCNLTSESLNPLIPNPLNLLHQFPGYLLLHIDSRSTNLFKGWNYS